MKKIKEDLNKCRCLKGISIEKRVTAMMFNDAIDKGILTKKVEDELFYTRTKKGDLDLLEKDIPFDEKLVRKYKRKFKRGLKK